jgi:hypothetical protein
VTKFLDGPAKDVVLLLQRVPFLLRAVQNAEGKWDALNELSDKASAGETVYVYRMKGLPGWCHVRSGKPGRSGMYKMAVYEYLEPQPAPEKIRNNSAWVTWCYENAGRLGYVTPSGSPKRL